mmetsp:Transcript_21116/g.69830  ORF Transcript_21116/g.69830 Transcript_21116/m.69830 type:complete len:204 (+) Transcript_21116:1809-2420(+)
MPRFVVPSAPPLPAFSASSMPSMTRCPSRSTCARDEMTNFSSEESSPNCLSSSKSVGTWTTTPLPMTLTHVSRSMPQGRRWNAYFLPSTSSVWPAFAPPLNRHTRSARPASTSTSLPLPSSPHWAPSTTMTRASWRPVTSLRRRQRRWMTSAAAAAAAERARRRAPHGPPRPRGAARRAGRRRARGRDDDELLRAARAGAGNE